MSWKLSCPVLRGGESGDARTLPDINQTRARKRIETKHQVPVPQVNYGVLQVWRESREDSPIHAIGIEVWDGHNKLAVVH